MGDDKLCADLDDSAPKHKTSSGNEGFNVKWETFVPSLMSSVDRWSLQSRLQSELDTVRDLQKKLLVSSRPVAVHGTRPSSSSAAPNPNFRPRGPDGRFLRAEYSLRKQCQAVLKDLMAHKHGWVFNDPVDVVKWDIPDYYDVIKHPMDLGTINAKLAGGSYASPWDFAADVRLTFSNAMTYNSPGIEVYRMAEAMSKLFERRWKPIAKMLNAADVCANNVVGADIPASMKRTAPPVDHRLIAIKPSMTPEMKEDVVNRLASFGDDIPPDIIDLLGQHTDYAKKNDNGELEFDPQVLSDGILFELKKLLDNMMLEKEAAAKSKHVNEVANLSGRSHSSTQGADVDIVGSGSSGSPSYSSSGSPSGDSDPSNANKS